ncbi:MAG: hypothetical protein HFG28_10680 [Eubacterium sp.]|jgi:Aspartyl-tRNA synthetase|nr:hypothetical protein [Eubacterium sp.]
MQDIMRHLKSKKVKEALALRNIIKKTVRDFMSKEGFIEVDTPIMGPQIPEYSNNQYEIYDMNKNVFYLPQSPQIYKQILMNAGYEKYFQFAHCFRYDEKLDSSHLNEFMQIDVEMQTSDKNKLMSLVEQILRSICSALDIDCKTPFPVINGTDCFKIYGTDKPDLRKNNKDLSFIWIVDLPLLEKASFERAKVVGSNICIHNENYILSHHAFASPLNWKWNMFENDLLNVLTDSFDLVLNGIEICSGDIRTNDEILQRDIFDKLDINTELYNKYLKLLNPEIRNGGFALGMERILMALTNNNIEEMNAFNSETFI